MISDSFFKLEEVMPILMSRSNQLLSKDNIPNSDNEGILDRIPDWVKKNVRLGNLGEYIVWQHLNNSKYGYQKLKWISRESDNMGYDISAQRYSEVFLFEVKTSQNISKDVSFFLTMNELKAAFQHPLNYFVFYIEIEHERAWGTIIKNIALKIKRFIKDEYIVNNDDIHISYDQLKITLPKSDTLSHIDLTNELKNILKMQSKLEQEPNQILIP